MRSAFRISVQHVSVLFLATLVAVIPHLAWEIGTGHLRGSLFGLLLAFLFNFLNIVPITVLISDICVGNRPTLAHAYRRAFGRVTARVLGASIVSGLLIIGGMLLLVIPGILFVMWYGFVGVVSALEPTTVRRALKRSRELGRGFYLRNATVLILVALVATTPYYLAIAAVARLFGSRHGPSLPDYIFVNVGGAAVSIPISVVIVLLYYDMRVRKEAYDSTRLSEDLKR